MHIGKSITQGEAVKAEGLVSCKVQTHSDSDTEAIQ